MSTQNLENFIPPIQSDGLNTNTNTSLGGTLAVTGAATLSSTLLVTGVATFSSAPVFSAGKAANVILATGTTALTVAQSGSTVIFNGNTGAIITLPTPASGLEYNFIVGVTPTVGTHGIVTNASGSQFLKGNVSIVVAAGTTATFSANGTSNFGVSLNGTTTGGIFGSNFKVIAISSTVWAITGQVTGSGALATPIS